MRYGICLLQRVGFVMTALFLLSVNPSTISKSSADVNSPKSVSTTTLPVPKSEANAVDPATRASIENSYGNLPMSFEVNNGQVDDAVKFLSKGNGYTLFLASNEAVLSFRRSPSKEEDQMSVNSRKADASRSAANNLIRLRLIGSNSDPKITGINELPGKSNYFIGNDPTMWRTNVSNYTRVKIEDAYPGIDLVYYGNHRRLEYDWIVAPGADPRTIKFAIEGYDKAKIDAQGNLVLDKKGELCFNRPFIYQQQPDSRTQIAGRYVFIDKDEVGFEIGKYDSSLPLVIDPVLSYSTYLGGINDDRGNGIAVDSSGNAYITGQTYSTDFPTADPLQANNAGSPEIFVTKLNASGNGLVYSTYLGGSDDDLGSGIAVDSFGNAYVTGQTYSTDFPTVNPLQANNAGSPDAFVAKLNTSGNGLVYSTYLGGVGDELGSGIAVDSFGNVYVTGETGSSDFPTAGPLQASNGGFEDVFVAKLNAPGSALVYSTYLGGNNDDIGNGIAVDSFGNAFVAGETYSTNYPTANPFQANKAGEWDAFVTKFNASGNALVYSTYLGGSLTDLGKGVAVDSFGNVCVAGVTYSTDFPTVNPIQVNNGGSADAFVAKLNASGSALAYSTYLGGSGNDQVFGIAVDSFGHSYVTGVAYSTDYPTAKPFQPNKAGDWDVIVTKLNASGSALNYSSYLGGTGNDQGYGIAVDSSGNAYVTGVTYSADFSTTSPFQSNNAGSGDAFVTKTSFPKTFGDIDGDGKTEFTVWRPGNGIWYTLFSGSSGTYTATLWGLDTDIPVAGDYDGDSKLDLAVWRPETGIWYTLPSSSPGTYTAAQWGLIGDNPVSGDYDGDDKTDIAVWRSGVGIWYTLLSGSPGAYTAVTWGSGTDISVPADYDGDGKSDVAVWRPDSGTWYILPSNSPGTYISIPWGLSSDIPTPGDYDGDGIADMAVWRPSTGVFYILPSASPGNYTSTQWGLSSDIPVSGDYDGDGKSDLGVWRPADGVWYILPSNSPGTYTATQWGMLGDEPISVLTGIVH